MIYIIIFILIFMFIIMYLSYNYIEQFTSFCALRIKDNKCNSIFQKDDSRYIFDSFKGDCMDLQTEECVENNEDTKISYYCNIGGKCKEYNGTIMSSRISANNCGTDPLNNQLLLPYSSLEECNKTVDVCDKHNVPNRSPRVNKEECLKDVNCGFCNNNNLNQGICIGGTASGPIDLQKYYFCTSDFKNSEYKYIYGNHQFL